MRIGVNGLFLKPSQVGGAEFVLKGLLLGLAQNQDIDLYVFINAALVDWLRNLNLGNRVNVVPLQIMGNRFISEAVQLPMIANSYQLDGLINTNYFTPWRLLLSTPCTTIIYDLNYLHFPDFFSQQKKLWLWFAHQFTLTNADTTVTISNFVQQDILKRYRPKRAPVVIYTPIIWERFAQPIAPAPVIHSPFILSVANHYQHKNLATLIKAFQKLPQHFSEIKLVLVGQLPNSLVGVRRDRCDDIPNLVKELNLQERVIVTGYINDAELAWYYQQAAMFVYPSLFEGFGMPPVEALGMGLPTLTTRCTAIPEATLNLAQYVDNPLDVDEWGARIAEILNMRSKFVPSTTTVETIRATYAPTAIAQQYINLFRK